MSAFTLELGGRRYRVRVLEDGPQGGLVEVNGREYRVQLGARLPLHAPGQQAAFTVPVSKPAAAHPAQPSEQVLANLLKYASAIHDSYDKL